MEALGMVWAMKHFRAYLLGLDCTVFTDHAPLKAMVHGKATIREARQMGQRDF